MSRTTPARWILSSIYGGVNMRERWRVRRDGLAATYDSPHLLISPGSPATPYQSERSFHWSTASEWRDGSVTLPAGRSSIKLKAHFPSRGTVGHAKGFRSLFEREVMRNDRAE